MTHRRRVHGKHGSHPLEPWKEPHDSDYKKKEEDEEEELHSFSNTEPSSPEISCVSCYHYILKTEEFFFFKVFGLSVLSQEASAERVWPTQHAGMWER